MTRTPAAGTWREFLIEDANVTRKAFTHWWNESYLKSSQAKTLPKSIRREIKGLIEARPPNPVSKASLLPGTVLVIEAWEAIPLVPGTAEWAKARVRLIRDLIIDGTFQQYKYHFDFVETIEELGDVRCWIYQREDGTLDHYRSLAQPWSYKDIEWSNAGPITKLADQASTATALPETPANATSNLNRLRISGTDFYLHIMSLHSPSVDYSQPPVQMQTASKPSTTITPSIEGEIVQHLPIKQERVDEEDTPGEDTQHPLIKQEPGTSLFD
ncbi:MAG: hypothetical protein Q9171_003199 [Xanthocarpia ochracea]